MISRSSIAFAVFSFSTLAHSAEGELVARPLGETEAAYGHLEFVPPGYAASAAKHPVLVVLHGIGEIGDGTSNLMGPMTANGPGRQIAQGSTWYADEGMLVFIPQSTEWWDSTDLHAFIGYIAASFRVDPRRVYITGLSMGGGGTWDYAAAHPGRATAVVPICGASTPGDGTPFVGTSVWAFHSWGDGTVPRDNSVGWVDAVADATAAVDVANVLVEYPNQNGDPLAPAEVDMTAVFDGSAFAWHDGVDTSGDSILRLTLYTDNSHDSWSRTYDDPAVLDWFAGQRKPPAIEGDDDIVIDNLDAEATFEGTWARSEAVPGFWWWDYHEAAVAPDAVATFATDLPPAIYEVYVSWSAGPDRALADLEIDGALEAPATMQIDMTQGGGFTSLGTYTFEEGPASVSLRASAGASGVLVGDAVGFVYRGGIPGADTSAGEGGVDTSGADDDAATTGVLDDAGIDTGPPDAESSGQPAQDEGGSVDGCGCDHRSSATHWAWSIVLLGLGRRRRG